VLYAVAEEREAFRKEIEAHNYVRNFETRCGARMARCSRWRRVALPRARQRPHRTLSGLVLDITEKKRSEDEMRRRNRELNALNAMAVIATQSFDLMRS